MPEQKIATAERDDLVIAEPRRTAAANFTTADAYQSWRVIARNPNYTGETEGLGFSNGQGVLPALPASAKCQYDAGTLDECSLRSEGNLCRVHRRVLHLNGFRNYPFTERITNARGQRQTRTEPGYRVLSEAEYEAEYGEREDGADELPADF